MKFTALPLAGAFLIDPEPVEDERGCFARTWCAEELAAHGLATQLAQCSISFNARKGTLRGIHYQTAPNEEAKLVRCTRGVAFDVLLDLRRASSTFGRWVAVELSADNRSQVYVPEGVAHGFQTLEDGTEIFYQITAAYRPDSARGVRWDDPLFGIAWPEGERILSDRDRQYPDFVE